VTESVTRAGALYVACRRLDEPGTFGINANTVVPIASMYKVLLALEVADAFCDGRLRPDAQLTIPPTQRSPGGTGLNQFAYPTTVALRDLLCLALVWSDNTASDLLLDLVGLDAVQARAQRLELRSVTVVGGCRTLLSRAGADFGYASDAEAEATAWRPTAERPDLSLERTTRASPADLVQLGCLLDDDRAGAPDACRLVRELMTGQAWKTRFAEAFPDPAWTRHTKTGSLSPWRGEFGIVRRKDGLRLSLAVVLRQHDAWTPDSVVDATIRDAAVAAVRLAVQERQPTGSPWR
jgi:beta-lactamase class A